MLQDITCSGEKVTGEKGAATNFEPEAKALMQSFGGIGAQALLLILS